MKVSKVCELFEMSVNYIKKTKTKKGVRFVSCDYLLDSSKVSDAKKVCDYYGIRFEIIDTIFSNRTLIKIW